VVAHRFFITTHDMG